MTCYINRILLVALGFCATAGTHAAEHRNILFFSKSSGWEHDVIKWKEGQPSFVENVLVQLGQEHDWKFTFSKDGSKISADYLAQFNTVIFYTTGNLLTLGTDNQPPMSPEGKQALFDYVREGKGFVGVHSACDTFHTSNESNKGPDRYRNHGKDADSYVRFIGGEFIRHGDQQKAKNTVIDSTFPGFEELGDSFEFKEEWYSLKDFTPDIHVLTVIDAPSMHGNDYDRPPYPTTWARTEGEGRVWYTAMGHREDVWENPIFRQILVGGIEWALGDVPVAVSPNIEAAAPGAYTNQKYPEEN